MGQVRRHIGRALACASFTTLLPGVAGAAVGCPNANTPATAASVPVMRTAVVCLVNQQRAERGLPPLTVAAKLNVLAQRWSRTMVAHNQFSHARFVQRIDAVHYNWQVAEENIATGYDTPSGTVTAWMASPDHCRNILSPSVRQVGTGERPAPVRSYASSPATWTQDFGLPANQPPPSRNTGPASHCPY
jgi:uncharacterized protein YkwD